MDEDLLCSCLRFLYRWATKNMAAPYTAAPATTATPIPTEVPLIELELSAPPPRGAPSLIIALTVEVGDPVPVPGAEPPISPPARMGNEGLILFIRVLIVGFGLL